MFQWYRIKYRSPESDKDPSYASVSITEQSSIVSPLNETGQSFQLLPRSKRLETGFLDIEELLLNIHDKILP